MAKPGTEDSTAIGAALDGVAPRLRQVREQRGFSLTEMSERTGISKSTLSRLENGQRKPSLELLLSLAQAYRVPLDDLAGRSGSSSATGCTCERMVGSRSCRSWCSRPSCSCRGAGRSRCRGPG